MCCCPCCLKHTYIQTQTHISNVNILWINTHGAVNIVQFACVARTLYVLLYTPGTQFKFCTTDLIWGSLISLSLPLSLSLSLFHTFFHMPPYLHPQSLPPSLPPFHPACSPSLCDIPLCRGQRTSKEAGVCGRLFQCKRTSCLCPVPWRDRPQR